jgi:pimeloyl-ACP methyl ester carboxylesterase
MRLDGIAYEAAGGGDAIVFLHGGLLDRHSWDREFDQARATHYAVRYDARGHGRSDGIPAGDHAAHADLIALLDHLGLDRVAAVGLSLGARTLIDAAIVYPHRFSALLLASPGYSGIEFTDPFVIAQDEAMDRAAAAQDLDGLVEAFLRAWVDGPHRSPAEVDPAVRERCRAAALTALAKPQNGGRLVEVGAADRLGELRMPVDVVLGGLDSTDILAAGARIAAAAPNVRTHHIVEAGHSLNLDQPDAFGAVLGLFLSDHRQSG